MTPERIAYYVFKSIPDSEEMVNLELIIDHENDGLFIRFEWMGSEFIVNQGLVVDQLAGGKRTDTAASKLMTELLKANITA